MGGDRVAPDRAGPPTTSRRDRPAVAGIHENLEVMALTLWQSFDSVLARARDRRGVALMGICNVTPDSFSDGGQHFAREAAFAHVDRLVAEGADLVDVGGESTRPGAQPVPAAEQLDRVLSVVRFASQRALVSIDTTSAEVADACLQAGASVVNDVSCLADVELAQVCARRGGALVIMHARGSQTSMKGFSEYPDDAYGDVVDDVLTEWREAADRARACGVERVVMDPGLGFAKNARQSTTLLASTRTLVDRAGVPVLVGASRKSMFVVVDPKAGPQERLGASVAAACHAARSGAALLRVHDVRATRQAIDLSRLLAPSGNVDA